MTSRWRKAQSRSSRWSRCSCTPTMCPRPQTTTSPCCVCACLSSTAPTPSPSACRCETWRTASCGPSASTRWAAGANAARTDPRHAYCAACRCPASARRSASRAAMWSSPATCSAPVTSRGGWTRVKGTAVGHWWPATGTPPSFWASWAGGKAVPDRGPTAFTPASPTTCNGSTNKRPILQLQHNEALMHSKYSSYVWSFSLFPSIFMCILGYCIKKRWMDTLRCTSVQKCA